MKCGACQYEYNTQPNEKDYNENLDFIRLMTDSASKPRPVTIVACPNCGTTRLGYKLPLEGMVDSAKKLNEIAKMNSELDDSPFTVHKSPVKLYHGEEPFDPNKPRRVTGNNYRI